MITILRAGVAVLALYGGVAAAQTATETTTTQSTTAPGYAPAPAYAPAPVGAPVAAPPVGTLSSTRTTRAVDAYGNQVNSRQTTYRNANGVAEDSRTVTTTAPALPPPPVTTTTTTESTSSGPQ
jgi:hypothetical protein